MSVRRGHARPGQAMLETVLAAVFVSFVFIVLFGLSRALTGKILLEHAAMRVARARTVGMNGFMCGKTARVAVIPVAGKRLWPEGDALDASMELGRIPVYMQTKNAAIARGVLDYEGWNRLDLDSPDDCRDIALSLGFSVFGGSPSFRMKGAAGMEDNHSLYLTGP